MPGAGHSATVVASVEDLRTVEALRAGDEATFASLVKRYSPAMLRLATVYVRSHAVAEEVVQEAWLGVIGSLERFEGRSSLKTWIFRILTNCAKTRGERERRTIPFSALVEAESDEPSVEPERFLDPSSPRWAGHWASSPTRWDDIPEQRVQARETRSRIEEAIDALPPVQRQVITLRDVHGWSAEEVCDLLGLSEVNQRVLLHRARSRVRRALENYLAGDD